MPGRTRITIEPWDEAELERNWWLLVVAFVVDNVSVLPQETEKRLFRGWRGYVGNKLKAGVIRTLYARHPIGREEAIKDILAELGCPNPEKLLGEVLGLKRRNTASPATCGTAT